MRFWLLFIYALITIITGIQVILNNRPGSVGHGVAALVACAICYVASTTVLSCFFARHEQHYSAKELSGIAGIAVLLTCVSLALVSWSGFWLTIYGIEISGFQWALMGSVVGLINANSAWLR